MYVQDLLDLLAGYDLLTFQLFSMYQLYVLCANPKVEHP